MVKLKFFEQKDFPEVSYTLDENQLQYTATAEQALKRIEERKDTLAFPITIFENDEPAGFFVLDFGNDKLELTDNHNSMLLRSFSINSKRQGKGIGKAAMVQVDDFVRENFKDCDEIVLAVNQNNISAYRLYLAVGYQYEGKTRIGRSGPQYLMSKKL
ncbi:Acetyltransferase (GNAT) family protein [Chryseobacterium taichungense]|uniref:Acetyltransferase (GNAT) family protein n=1 Tax=Chryseobacterium taichungense TaxID=295069 RepID=A0A1H8AAR4_9FLAO|nr:GNAT family N-acetyltransferase [Chryseobacterium taichungense]SEM66657.1 Acetyltransferase (GNAT) family protein [Chryseobacterium taichungense]